MQPDDVRRITFWDDGNVTVRQRRKRLALAAVQYQAAALLNCRSAIVRCMHAHHWQCKALRRLECTQLTKGRSHFTACLSVNRHRKRRQMLRPRGSGTLRPLKKLRNKSLYHEPRSRSPNQVSAHALIDIVRSLGTDRPPAKRVIPVNILILSGYPFCEVMLYHPSAVSPTTRTNVRLRLC